MEFLGHVLLAVFIGLVIFAALSFGFMLLVWFVGFAVTVSVLVMMRGWFQRMWFLYSNRDPNPPKTIEVDYRDISDEE
jgi:hypothetical protein